MRPKLELTPFRGLDDLRRERSAWEAAFAAAEVDPLCNAPDWGLAYAESWCADADVFGWVARAGADVVGFLPFRREPRRGRFALRRALFLADGSFDSDYLDLLTPPDQRGPVLEAVLDALAATRGIQAAVFAGLPDDSPTLPLLRAALERRGLGRREHAAPCAAAALQESLDAFLTLLPKRMRSKVRKAVRDAEAREARLVWCEEAESLDAHMEALYAQHALRWEEAGQAGSFAEPRRRRFYGRLAHEWLQAGRLRLARLELEGEAIAYQLGVVANATYYQIQEGYLPAHAEWRCATALRALAIEHLIAQGVHTYDYLGGIARHKTDWGAVLRPCTTLGFALPGLRGRLAYGARAALDRWRARSAE